jgi:voltage-gated potassium channel
VALEQDRGGLGAGRVTVGLRRARRTPLQLLALRGTAALVLMLIVALSVLLGADGYQDDTGGDIGFVDALYYASVSVTTTGYGDITPITTGTRLATTLIVTPARIGFLLLLLGTTIELLTERWRSEYRRERWRRDVTDHYVICGYGVKGRAAARALRDDGVRIEDVIIIEPGELGAAEASNDGFTVIRGDATRAVTLREARVERARAVIVATDRDDSAVLITLTARDLAPEAQITVAVREEENRRLLERSGATGVVTSSETAGRLLGVTSRHPNAARVVEDLLDTAHGLMLVEREIDAMEIGRNVGAVTGQVPVAVMRGGQLVRIDDPDCMPLREGDLLVSLAGTSSRGDGNGSNGSREGTQRDA